MKNFKKFLCILLASILSVCTVSTVYYKSVHAMEWVGGALAFEEALKWLLAAIGITATAGMTDAYWNEYGDDFIDYAIENGATQQEVAEWQLKLCEGILDKGSQVWDSFKSWASSLVVNGASDFPSTGDGTYNFTITQGTVNSVCSQLNSLLSLNLHATNYQNDIVYGAVVCNHINYPNRRYYYLFLRDTDYTTYNYNNGLYFKSLDGQSFLSIVVGTSATSSSTSTSAPGSNSYRVLSFTNNIVVSDGMDVSNKMGWSISGGVADSNFISSFSDDIENIGVISSVLPDEYANEVALPMPGVSDSDNEASKDAYQDIIDAINDGTITQEQGVEQIQEILKIITYDTVTDKVVPPQVDPDTGEDKTKDDVIKENKENMGFTLGGLEAVFPFCIPWDIYAFLGLLVAEPTTPKFNFPFRDPTTKQDVMYEVDLTPFNPVAEVCRYGFDLIFIIGLALATRRMIGAGGE